MIEAAQPNLDLALLRELPNGTILLSVLNLDSVDVEMVAAQIRLGLAHVPAERIVRSPYCGMQCLPLDRALRKFRALAEGAAIVQR